MTVVSSDPFARVASTTPAASWLGAWETSADSAYCRDLQGRILAVNLSFARKFGRAAAAFVDSPAADLLHADDVAAFHAATTALSEPPYRGVGEHRWVTPQGVRWFSWEETGLR